MNRTLVFVVLGIAAITVAGVAGGQASTGKQAKFACKGGSIVIGNAKGLTGPLPRSTAAN